MNRAEMQAVVDKLERIHDYLQPAARWGFLDQSGILWPSKADRVERQAYYKACNTVRTCAILIKIDWAERQDSWL